MIAPTAKFAADARRHRMSVSDFALLMATIGRNAGNPVSLVREAVKIVASIDCYSCNVRKLDPSNPDATGLALCPECEEDALNENDHNDNHDAAVAGCKFCDDDTTQAIESLVNPTEPFVFNGVTITDPTLDETGRFEVDPGYYPVETTESMLAAQEHHRQRETDRQAEWQASNTAFKAEKAAEYAAAQAEDFAAIELLMTAGETCPKFVSVTVFGQSTSHYCTRSAGHPGNHFAANDTIDWR